MQGSRRKATVLSLGTFMADGNLLTKKVLINILLKPEMYSHAD